MSRQQISPLIKQLHQLLINSISMPFEEYRNIQRCRWWGTFCCQLTTSTPLEPPSRPRPVLRAAVSCLRYFCCSRLGGFMPKTKGNARWPCGSSYSYLSELLLHVLPGWDHFLFSSETVFILSLRACVQRRSARSLRHQLSKQDGSCLHIPPERNVCNLRAANFEENADSSSTFISLIK